MFRKSLAAALLIGTIFSLAIPISAESAMGEICCWLSFGEEAVTDGALEICRAGEPVPEGYRLGPEFGGGIIAGEDVPSAAFARWMSEKAEQGTVVKVNRNGLVRFRDLEPGMYLIRQAEGFRDYYSVEPYFACVSEELLLIDTYPELIPKSSGPRTDQYSEVYTASMGIAFALTGLSLFMEVKKRKMI